MTTVQVGDAATHNEKEVKTKYPVEDGTTAGTTKQTGKTMNLIPDISKVSKRKQVGL